MKFSLVSVLACSAIVSASWVKNLNYRSPSENHPALGISLSKVNKRNTPDKKFTADQLNFTHGVASGDPYPIRRVAAADSTFLIDSVILWTRVAPMVDDVNSNSTVSGYVPLYNHGPNVTVSTAPVCVECKVARTADFKNVESSGTAYTSSDIDYTVKVEATRLSSWARYYYQFNVCGSNSTASPLGRTKTTPNPGDYVSNVGLAVYSCSNFPFGFFNAFGNPVRKDSVDFVLHLGDYIYEYAGDGDYGYGQSIGRVPKPEHIIYTLYDYRARLATYRTDEDLLLSHQTYPWIPVWDLRQHIPRRSLRAKQHRSILRHGRRRISASAQRGARWRIISSQTVFSKINESVSYGNVNPLDYDAWDGYQANRNRTLNFLTQNNIGNNIVISGDSHASWVSDLVWLGHANYSADTGAGSLGVEFAGSAVSSPCPYGQNITQKSANDFSDILEAANPELHWNDLYYLNVSFFGLPTIVNRNPLEISLVNFTVKSGANALQRPIAGGIAESGSLKGGMIQQSNITNNTETGQYSIVVDDEEDI
ncbi:Alkaline phosphatase D [Fulvia fulva]|uniref:Alkaline phosphatase D n=1 Tax=Passalora fulva TaxID=5499 RepID=A0A9Q8LB61_PASFU|nr:Alkaline phosphatase D [Fulvia fulva]KAK4632300.1 Alkaline phosphatase D [Fulvia fulva]UJO14172.1 Alkaline phosphatase D [Fulvia fulva]WPV11829.1 Alkaline phosphatase D [Fulvia fulva]WPV25977.1 Alkaline phosphatase D [Fulvia fulva]